MKIARSILILFLLSITVHGYSQNSRIFRHLDINNGLAHTDALYIEQDDKGFIWIGTNSGLQRFDGRQLRTFLNEISLVRAVYNNRITSLRAQNDLLWIGSEGGLNCFDLKSEKFIPLKFSGTSAEYGLSTIQNLKIVGGNIWMLANGGLFRGVFDNKKSEISIQSIKEILSPQPVVNLDVTYNCIESDDLTTLWVGTSKGLIILKAIRNTMQLWNFISKGENVYLNNDEVNDLKYNLNELWVRSGNLIQVLSLEKETFKIRNSIRTLNLRTLSSDPNLLNAVFSKMILDREENLWLASSKGLVNIENPNSDHPLVNYFRYSQFDQSSLGGNNVSNLMIDKSNCLWVSTWGGGVSYTDLEQKKFNTLAENPDNQISSLKGTFVRAIEEDSNGMIWIGLRNNGINIFDPRSGRCYLPDELYHRKFQLTSNEVRSIKYFNGSMYIGTVTGINIVNLKDASIFRLLPGNSKNEISNSAVFSVEIDNKCQIWTGTWGGGINRIRLKGTSYEVLKLGVGTSPFSLSSDIVNYLLYDERKNEILATTSKGLNRIILDQQGNVSDVIYYRINDSSGSLSSEYLWPIVKQNDSVYWVGTLGGGLNRMVISDTWDKNKVGKYSAKSFSLKDGAPGTDIESILMDNNENLWLGGNGISKFNIALKEFWNFDINDGLQSNGFKIGSACKCKNGTLYFGGINGLNYFTPEDIRANLIKPMVAITGLRIHNQEITTQTEVHKRILLKEGIQYIESISLKYVENDFSLSFASLHFANPEKCKYKYMLDGYDINWKYISGDYPIANYSNLKYGDYIFYLDATNNDGLWNGTPITLKIAVNPPWWQTKWAYSTYLVLFLLAMYGLYYNISRWIRLRHNLKLAEAEERRKEEMHQMKLQFFTNISHEFKTPLTLILSPAEKLLDEKTPENEQKKLLTLILNNANRLLHLVNELMDFRKAEMGKLTLEAQKTDFSSFCFDVYQQFVPLAKGKNITLNFESNSKSHIWFDNEMMAKILFNLFSNALKYTNDTGTVRAEVFEGLLSDLQPYFNNKYEVISDNTIREFCFIKVHDTGIGISEGSIGKIFDRFYQVNKPSDRHLGTGIGLALLKSLVNLHHGYIQVSSERCSGTEIIVGFPIDDKHLNPDEKLQDNVQKPGIYSEVFRTIEPDYKMESNSIESPDSVDEYSTLLIVEDNEELRNVLADNFRQKYRVFVAEDGQKGFDLALKEIPSLIISDIMMPVMTGFEMITLLKEEIQTCHIPVVFLTAKSSIESQIEGIELGAVEYIPKPFNIRLLDVKINQFMENLKKLKEKYATDVFAPTREIVKNEKDQKFLEDLFEIIDNNIDNSDFSVNDIGMKLGIGRSNLYKKIKSLTDQSLGEFIRTYRLKKAAKILLSEDITVSEVIYRVGMNSHSYFTKSFKSQFNMTPSEFIMTNSKNHKELLN